MGIDSPLRLEGKATDHVWAMQDVEGYIGLRLDCGDGGTIYLTPYQAREVIDTLGFMLQGHFDVYKSGSSPETIKI